MQGSDSPSDPSAHPSIKRLERQVLSRQPEFDQYFLSAPHHSEGQLDYLLAAEEQTHEPDIIFWLLRWGGQFVYASKSKKIVTETAARFAERGFKVVRGPTELKRPFLALPFLTPRAHYFIARKILLVPPREFSDRFTYQVQLREPDDKEPNWSVQKEVPSLERVVARLQRRFPDSSEELIFKRARKFTDKIFPLFLTREAAMLKILERDLPATYRGRVPRALEIEKDERGMVRRLRMNWLRNGGKQISQMAFAQQATELLQVLHDVVGVIHLDLRLDNMVVTERGVGFVDFGSSVRVGEKLSDNPLLETLFDDLMRTSQIQKMLERMTLSGKVTSPVINMGLQKVDKSVDFFYLAVQMCEPLQNPDFAGLVHYDPESDEAEALRALSEEILRPRNVENPKYKSAGDILRGIQLAAERLRQPVLTEDSAPRPTATPTPVH